MKTNNIKKQTVMKETKVETPIEEVETNLIEEIIEDKKEAQRKKRTQYSINYAKSHPEKAREWRKKYEESHKDKIAAYHKEYNKRKREEAKRKKENDEWIQERINRSAESSKK